MLFKSCQPPKNVSGTLWEAEFSTPNGPSLEKTVQPGRKLLKKRKPMMTTKRQSITPRPGLGPFTFCEDFWSIRNKMCRKYWNSRGLKFLEKCRHLMVFVSGHENVRSRVQGSIGFYP